jgi:L-serine dehydratase
MKKMKTHLSVMKESVSKYSEKVNTTKSCMINGGAFLMKKQLDKDFVLFDKKFTELIMRLLSSGECNACMGKIVAAPTAGASAVIPGTLLYIADLHKISERNILKSLFIAGGIGEVIALNASLSGSTHGCQAEVGSASAMAAAALVSLFTEDMDTIESAACFALKNVLGLVCDPIAGLVEVPCVKRNVMGGVNALSSAEMALAGIKTVLPFDEVVDALRRVGDSLPYTLKETALGGLAICPTAKKITESL